MVFASNNTILSNGPHSPFCFSSAIYFPTFPSCITWVKLPIVVEMSILPHGGCSNIVRGWFVTVSQVVNRSREWTVKTRAKSNTLPHVGSLA